MTDRYLVIGNPIAHSKSPLIHQLFAKQTKQSLVYEKLLVVEAFDQAIHQIKAQGVKGANITAPFKQAAFKYANAHDKYAKLAKAANTLLFKGGNYCFAANTDGIGFIRDLKNNLGQTIANKKILILGAGGAVRGILGPLLLESPNSITIANRTKEKAKQLAMEFFLLGVLQGTEINKINPKPFDLVINATAGDQKQFNKLPCAIITPQTFCYDLNYANEPTPFLTWAKSLGCQQTADGFGMLVEQAAESFFLWRGVKPNSRYFSTKTQVISDRQLALFSVF